jgi:YD repeat-containing protein
VDREINTAKLVIAALACAALSVPASAQQTTTYAYDALGRLTNSGQHDGATAYYVYDGANNRKSARCCDTVGGWQVTDDGFDPYFYLQTYPDIRLAGVDPYQH